MNFDLWSVIFGAFGLGVLKLVWEAIRFGINRRDKLSVDEIKFDQRQSDIQSLFNDLITGAVQIQEYLEEYVNSNNASRILILKMENGGGIPQLGTVQHISVLNESLNQNSELSPVKQDFQKYSIDSSYQKLMGLVLESKFFISEIKDMEDGMVKTIYEREDIKKVIVAPIVHIPSLGTDNNGFFIYISIQFKTNVDITPKMEGDFLIMKNKIEKLFKEFYIKRINKF